MANEARAKVIWVVDHEAHNLVLLHLLKQRPRADLRQTLECLGVFAFVHLIGVLLHLFLVVDDLHFASIFRELFEVLLKLGRT